MCGIAAAFAYRAGGIDRAELDAAAARMISRGPDAGGTWLSDDGRVGLASRRLAIIDLTPEGVQPMWDVQRELVVVFNGEIYNHAELRASLIRCGTQFHSRTDTEVLLALYRRDGERMVELLRGMYAFVIWDTTRRRMFVARDPYGIKPLYYADDGSTIRLASEVKALLAGGRVSREIDLAGAASFFLTGSVSGPFTIRAAIRSIDPGTSFHVEPESGRAEPRRHFSIGRLFRAAEGTPVIADPTVLLKEAVDESVRHHLVSDVPVGVFLSSGIDSSALALTATRLSSRPLLTFTLSFPEFSEAPLAERFAAEIGATHTTRVVEREEFLADLPAILDRMDQPTIDGVNTWFVSKAAHEAGVKVALSGIGGDELFGSYPSFRSVPRLVRLARTPLAARVVRMVSRHPKAKLIDDRARTYEGAWLLKRGLFLPEDLPAILGKDQAQEALRRLDLTALARKAMDGDPRTAFGRVAALEAGLYLRNQLLRDTDWSSMSHSVEVRTPLVDATLLRQIAPVILHYGSRGKAMLASQLPSYLRDQPKRGFFVPMREWMDLAPDGTSTRMRSWALRVWETLS